MRSGTHLVEIIAQYTLPTRQKAKTSLIHVPGRFDQELGRWKPTKTKDAQQCITLYTTIHHSMLCYYFRHTTDFIGQNTRGRSPHASLDINTTSNYCPVSLVPRSSVGRASDARFRGPWIKSHQYPTFFFFWSSFVESMLITTQKSHFKEKKKEKKQFFSFNLSANSERYSDQELGWWTFQGHNKVWRQTSL